MLDQEALVYLDLGWCVYPAHHVDVRGKCSCGKLDCPCPGKHPIGRWVDFQNRLPTKREVKLWFRSMECNIGIVTGSVSGVVVVDVDNKQGRDNIRKLGLPETLTSRTGGGGYHHFYSYRETFQSKTRVMEGVDIRGEGGYVVLPPSRHNSGRNYEWSEPMPLAKFDPAPFAPYYSRSNGSVNGNGWTEELWQGVPEGSRSTSAARLAGRYFNLGLSAGEVWILMLSWNQRNMPPLSETELQRTVKWVREKHATVYEPIILELGRLLGSAHE